MLLVALNATLLVSTGVLALYIRHIRLEMRHIEHRRKEC